MLTGNIIKAAHAAFQPLKPQPARPRQFREVVLKIDLAAKIKFSIVTTLDLSEVKEGLRNGTVAPDWKRQILTLNGSQIGTFTIAEAGVRDVA